MTNIETKALCSVLRKAESQGERSLVEKMIEICDPQSGLRFEELWDWWKEYKQQDMLKTTGPNVAGLWDHLHPNVNVDPRKFVVTC